LIHIGSKIVIFEYYFKEIVFRKILKVKGLIFLNSIFPAIVLMKKIKSGKFGSGLFQDFLLCGN